MYSQAPFPSILKRPQWIKKILGLAATPRTVEGIDIAHLGGTETVASLVRFLDGLPFKQGYRKFRIKSVEGIDDYASIREVVFRRFRKQRDSEEIFPDVILIDGGKGQLNAALDAFKLLGIEPPCLISLAKKDEEIFRPGDSNPSAWAGIHPLCVCCNMFAMKHIALLNIITMC